MKYNYSLSPFIRTLLVFALLTVGAGARAQGLSSDQALVDQTMQDLTVVAGIGGAGAILGLSTLSFVDNPSRHLRNIVVGAAIGVIAGVIVVAYNQANKSQQYIVGPSSGPPRQRAQAMGRVSRVQWPDDKNDFLDDRAPEVSPLQVGWSWNF